MHVKRRFLPVREIAVKLALNVADANRLNAKTNARKSTNPQLVKTDDPSPIKRGGDIEFRRQHYFPSTYEECAIFKTC
ncbi:hypothetical protein LSAT2_009401 [Lamellibrachia satsuma]|nr:hypothetical protein LSAT2_009401 [Lamellibrachia satsuma]